MNRYFFALLIVGCALSAVAQQAKSTKPVVLFTIDGQPSYTDEFVYLYKKNHLNKDQDFTAGKVDEYLNLFVNFKLKIAEAKKRHLDTTAKFNRELKTYHEELKKPYRAEKDVLDKLTREAFEHLTYEVKASHILVLVKPDATPEDTTKAFEKIGDIRKRVLAGEDFEKLARELSEDPTANQNGGSLGYFTAMQMVYPFEEAAYQTKPGDVSPIVRTRFGYHIIKVFDKRQSLGEVEVSHILLRAKDGDVKAKNLIFDIYDQLKSGRSWDELCKQYSEDTNTKNTGGKLRPFGVGALAAVPEFEATAFALQKPGEVSDPFQSGIGWHIIRLEKKILLPPYKDVEPSLKKRVARDERMKISEQAMALRRRKELGVIEFPQNKKKILALADTSVTKGKWKFTGGPELKTLPLIAVDGKTSNVSDFIAFVESQHAPSKLRSAALMEQHYQAWVEEKIDAAEDAKIIRENPDFEYLLTEYREGILLFEIMEKEIWNKASEDTLGQRKFYHEHAAKYTAGDRVEARIFSTNDHQVIENFKKKVAQGDTIKDADLKKFKSVQNFRKYEKGESKVIDKISWLAGLQETSIDGIYYLVEVERLVAPGTKTLEEARAKVIADYQDSMEKIWVAQLQKKFKLSISPKGKTVVLNELVKK